MRLPPFILGLLLAGFVRCAADDDGYAVPRQGRVFEFPRDHGSHPDFKIEWWYLTGHLFAQDGRRFGWQVTFFRRANRHDAGAGGVETFGNAHLYLAHVALLDVASGRFLHQEQLQRDGWDAHSAPDALDVRCGPWRLRMTEPAASRMEVVASIPGEAALELALEPMKPLVVFGQDGVSRKGATAAASSHYLTFPRLRAAGKVTLQGRTIDVTGEAWMDHEFSSSQLDTGQIGWDWAAVQLRDGTEIMLYRMRRADGGTDPFSTLAVIDHAGRVRHFGPDAWSMKPLQTWRSPHTGASYPAGFEIELPAALGPEMRTLRLRPLAADQELTGHLGGIAYWEGACRAEDGAGRDIGSAFIELTGYAAPITDRVR